MPSVFFNKQEVMDVGEEWINILKMEAEQSDKHRARLCLHQDPKDLIQEMIIVLSQKATIRPHRSPNKPETISVLEGKLKLFMFDDEGTIKKTLYMEGTSNRYPSIIRMSSGPWYTYIPLTEFIVIHEVTSGPFRKDDTIFPNWGPEEGPELDNFLTNIHGRTVK